MGSVNWEKFAVGNRLKNDEVVYVYYFFKNQ